MGGIPEEIENYVHRIGRCGRAERMGLAICLVSGQREKVWYHKCPSKGRNCVPAPGNTKLTLPFGPDNKLVPEDKERWLIDEGGCTYWYDESNLMGKLTERIGQAIPVMDREDFSVEDLLESPLEEKFRKKKVGEENKEPPSRRQLKRKKADPAKQAIVYGARRNDAVAAVVAGTATAIAPTVGELHTLETKIQQIFARATYSGIGGAPVAGAAGATSDGAKPLLAAVAQSGITPSAASEGGKPAKKKVRW